jgi:hypothetical protein
MAAILETVTQPGRTAADYSFVSEASVVRTDPPPLEAWLKTQSVNAMRNAAAMRPFRKDEFGLGPASPSDAHIEAVNDLTTTLRRQLLETSRQVSAAATLARKQPTCENLRRLTELKERSGNRVRLVEDIWKFYFELFGQRQSRFAPQLLACDRIALDCYQYVYTGLGRTRPIPSPGPFCYMETGFAPATFRRGVPLTRLGRRANPFPLIQLPYHRLVNPWTLSAVLHESAHNLQSDLGLWQVTPLRIARRLLAAGLGPQLARIWARWHKEIWADLCGLLLGGPSVVATQMDVVGRSPSSTFQFSPADVHPTPYLRVLISLELLRRMGFAKEAEAFRRGWMRIYPKPTSGTIPRAMLATFPQASRLVVDTIAFTPYEQLGGKSLAQAVKFEARDQGMVEQAGRRLAASRDPGIIPAIFLIGAARWALDHNLARPGLITNNFYRALVRR